MKTRWLLLILFVNILACSLAEESKSHKLVKRQSPPRPGGQRAFPLSRSRQFPPPEELEESEEYVNSEDEEEDKGAASPFRGRQPQKPPSEEDYVEDYSYTEAPKQTTPAPSKPTSRTVIFNNRFAARPRPAPQSPTSSTTTTVKPTTASTSRSRVRAATPAQSQRLDVIANILNKPPPPRPSERSISPARASNQNSERKLAQSSTESTTRRTTSSSRPRARGRFRPRSSTTTTTTTTTTEQPLEEYYYYYEDDEEGGQKNQPIATTTSTTTTTTTKKPSLPKRVSIGRRPSSGRSQSTSRPVVKFDPESQFAPPPEDVAEVLPAPASTKKFTTSTTPASSDPAVGAIPSHLRSKYKPRTDGRFIDFLRDPNRPRELKGFDLTDYPFYIKVPEDIEFDCDDKKDGYYASVPHKCQLFHYCFAGARYDFLCANYTLYDQTTFTCRFANNVDCPSSEKYYYRNDDLWKETTTPAPETTTPKKRRTTPKEEDYEDYDDYEEYEEERRRPPKRRRNRRKNRRKPAEDDDKE